MRRGRVATSPTFASAKVASVSPSQPHIGPAPPASAAAPGPARVELADPHAAAGPVEAEVTRVRKLTGFWRWLLILATAATILLCINQQFTLRFFVGYTQLNTEYYYLLILCMLPFTFLIFPGSGKAPLDRVALVRRGAVFRDGRQRRLPDVQRAQGGRARLGVRRRADAGDRRRARHVGGADGGAAPHRGLEPAAERAAVHRLSAVCRCFAGSVPSRATSRRSSRRRPTTCSPARACSASRSRRSRTPSSASSYSARR